MTRMAKEGNHHNGADELLCEAAIAVDRALEEMDRKIDWLERLTPVNIDELGQREGSPSGRCPTADMARSSIKMRPLRSELFSLPVREIKNPIVEALMLEAA